MTLRTLGTNVAALNNAFARKTVFDLRDYGTVDTTGATDSNAAWAACVADWYAKGGGVIQLPAGTIKVTAKTTLPSGNATSAGATQQPPLTIRGAGGHFSGQNSIGSGGTRLLLTYQGAAVSGVQNVTVVRSPTGGTFTLTYGGQTTSALAYNATTTTVQTELQALSSIGAGNATVTGSAGAYVVTFAGTLATATVTLLTATSSLTGGTSPFVNIDLVQQGGEAGTKDAKIVTMGLGLLVFDNLVLQDTTAGSSTPFVYSVATTIKATSNVAVMGATQGTSCAQDAFVLGGLLVNPATPSPGYGDINSPFQGYGTRITGCYFRNIRRAVYGRTYCNQVIVSDNFFDKGCGTNLVGGACVVFDGGLGGPGQCSVNVITGNYFEWSGGYTYLIKLRAGQWTYIAGNGFEDSGANAVACIRMETSGSQPSVQNTIIGNYPSSYPLISEDALSTGANLVLLAGGGGSDVNTFPTNVKVLGATTLTGGATLTNLTSGTVFSHTIAAPTSATTWRITDGATDWLALTTPAGGTWLTPANLTVVKTLTAGDGSTNNNGLLNINGGSGGTSGIQFKRAGTNKWLVYDGGASSLYFRDSTNGVMLVTLDPGAGATGQVSIAGKLAVTGNVAFFGTTPIAKRATTADATDLATAITLANALKADLVAYGLKS